MAESVLKSATEVFKENRLGLKAADYTGAKSTLCAGCGHDAVSNQIVRAFYEMHVNPEQIVKFSGIGCSSKTPAYFISRAHGFNAVHGRMPSVATGAMLANKKLVGVGVSGDGDTASIGLGQFMHMVRRNVPLIYIIENNGVYGLTKGQFSATAEAEDRRGQRSSTDGPLCAGGGTGLRIRGPGIRRRSQADGEHSESGHRTRRNGGHRCHLALRHLQ